VQENDVDRIEVIFSFGGSGGGTVQDPSLALVRPFRLLLDEGKPIGTINYLFYESVKPYVLGALCYTPARRLLFFPGLIGRSPRRYSKNRTFVQAAGLDPIDHLTMESDQRTFHATLLGRNSKTKVLSSYKTKQILKGLTYWFGLSCQNEQLLQVCPEGAKFQLSSPPNDSIRRTEIIMKSREGAKFHTITRHPDSTLDANCFLHFDFLVDTRGGIFRGLRKWALMKDVIASPTSAPTGPSVLNGRTHVPSSLLIRGHPVTIPHFSEFVWVLVSVRKGILVEQAIVDILP